MGGYAAGAAAALLGLALAAPALRGSPGCSGSAPSARSPLVPLALSSYSSAQTAERRLRRHQPLDRRCRRRPGLPVGLGGGRARGARAARPRARPRAPSQRPRHHRTHRDLGDRGVARQVDDVHHRVGDGLGRDPLASRRRCGPPARAPSPASGVAVRLRKTLVTRTPVSTSSARTESARARRPNFDAAYAAHVGLAVEPGRGVREDDGAAGRAAAPGGSARVRTAGATRLTSSCSRHCSSGASPTGSRSTHAGDLQQRVELVGQVGRGEHRLERVDVGQVGDEQVAARGTPTRARRPARSDRASEHEALARGRAGAARSRRRRRSRRR